MTIDRIRQELWEIEGRRRTAIAMGLTRLIPSADKGRGIELQRELERKRLEELAAAVAAKRAAIAEVLMPQGGHWRAFVAKLAHHAVDLIAAHDVTAVWDGRRPRADRRTRTIFCGSLTTEENVAICLHELAHVIDPRADGEQHRHELSESLISPLAEVAAWRWAVNQSLIWTEAMHLRMVAAVSGYRVGATVPEQEAIDGFIADAIAHILPAPDTFEGRCRRADQVRREQKIRQIEAGKSKLAAAEARLRALGIK